MAIVLLFSWPTNQVLQVGKKTASHRANNRSLIVSAAYKLLAEEGYDATTMKEIANAAGVAPGLIHYYFSSKDQLLQEVLYAAGERYVNEVERCCNTLSPQQLLETTFTEPQQRVVNEPEWFQLRCDLLIFTSTSFNPLIIHSVFA